MDDQDKQQLLAATKSGVEGFLDRSFKEGNIDEESYKMATRNVFPTLQEWYTDEHIARISPQLQEGLRQAIVAERWEDLVNAYRQTVRFGTGGIRGMMGFDRQSVEMLAADGIGACILKGSNTINDVLLLRTSVGVAQFGQAQNPPLNKVVIGYDSRIRGHDFGKAVAKLFLAYGYTVYFFDEPCPYPEMTFAIPYQEIKGDIGILISASHNDYRYNGYKLSCCNGSQFDPKQRDEMYEKFIKNATTADIRLMEFEDVPQGKLVFLSGDERLKKFKYGDRQVLNIHKAHCDHVKTFLLTDDLAAQQAAADEPLCIAFCAFHGAGRRAVPRMLDEVGFKDVRIITHGGLNDLNGLFPSFEWRAGREQQPDPGDVRAARKAVEAFKAQDDVGSFDDVDILIGTDPDADRCGVVVKVPEDQRMLFGGQDWHLLPADSMWALVLWYRFYRQTQEQGQVPDADKKFIVLSHTTSDGISLLAKKHGLGAIKTWVGFAALAAAVRDVWERRDIPSLTEGREEGAEFCHPFVCEYQDITIGQRSINEAAMEQSNGFSILGGPPPDGRSLGAGGHVRDRTAPWPLLVAEIAAGPRRRARPSLNDQHIHLDRPIGLFVNHYEPDPMDGEYPGIAGDRKKKEILTRALRFFEQVQEGKELTFQGRKVTSAVMYRTGKYDALYPPSADFVFADEGLRFYLGDEWNHITVRPSGTGNSLRFHIQLHDGQPGPEVADLIKSKQKLYAAARAITDELREKLGAPTGVSG